ncbi:MAG: cobalt transporter CbiM [Deltaproteobacteria bacterium]|nr:cobalt transporter CbiM [Deltaproteobacteria bacterium]
MHIADGVLPLASIAAGWAGTGVAAGLTLRKVPFEALPKAAVMTSAFFVASLIHVPLGPTSIHLTLNGLVGIVLGPLAFPAILVGLILQALLFQHGGVLTIGVNTLMMGLPALMAYKIFDVACRFNFRHREAVAGFLAGALSIFFSGLFLALWLVTAGREFLAIAKLALAAFLPLMVVEGLVCAAVAAFLAKVKPEMLERTSHATDNPVSP